AHMKETVMVTRTVSKTRKTPENGMAHPVQTAPSIKTPLPGPKAQALLDRDHHYMSPSYTRVYPLVCARGSGAVIEDVDGNLFLDCTAGIPLSATRHCH